MHFIHLDHKSSIYVKKLTNCNKQIYKSSILCFIKPEYK
ncbi:hypothetical protein CSB69_1617 [Morganella morganii]|nr:hypothetical protein CSB69_1617 [Morganella morganii]